MTIINRHPFIRHKPHSTLLRSTTLQIDTSICQTVLRRGLSGHASSRHASARPSSIRSGRKRCAASNHCVSTLDCCAVTLAVRALADEGRKRNRALPEQGRGRAERGVPRHRWYRIRRRNADGGAALEAPHIAARSVLSTPAAIGCERILRWQCVC